MQANPQIKTLTADNRYGKFVVEPLVKGFGHTLGNALRRVMLSAIPGVAITYFQIEGVKHEFAPIKGVVEDTTQIILNLQKLAIRLHRSVGQPSEFTIHIDVTGPGEVTGADIQCPPELEIVNPELHIAQLDDASVVLKIDLVVEEGTGYRPPDQQEKRSTIGQLPVGSIFTPIRKVAAIVEPTRVGHETDYERLILEVWTNGSITPQDGINQGAHILQEYLRLFSAFGADTGIELRPFVFGSETGSVAGHAAQTRIEDLGFSVRTINCLKKEGIDTVAQLCALGEDELLRLRNFGRKSLTEVREKLDQLGIPLIQSASQIDDDDILGGKLSANKEEDN